MLNVRCNQHELLHVSRPGPPGIRGRRAFVCGSTSVLGRFFSGFGAVVCGLGMVLHSALMVLAYVLALPFGLGVGLLFVLVATGFTAESIRCEKWQGRQRIGKAS